MTASVCRFTIAMIFALSAIHSMRDWAVYTAQVAQYKILPVRLARIASWILPPVQLAIGIMLVITNTACMPGLALMALFTAAIAINVAAAARISSVAAVAPPAKNSPGLS